MGSRGSVCGVDLFTGKNKDMQNVIFIKNVISITVIFIAGQPGAEGECVAYSRPSEMLLPHKATAYTAALQSSNPKERASH